MANIKSNYIDVFPCVGRGAGFDPEAELTNEGNLTQIIRSLYKRDSFVISDSIGFSESGALSKDFEFVIYGFYFKVKAADTYLHGVINSAENEYKHLYAGIRINQLSSSSSTYQLLSLKNEATNDIQVLDTVDDEQAGAEDREKSEFQGIVFGISEESVKSALKLEDEPDDNIKILYLYDGSNIPNSSKLHFKTSEILNINERNTETPLSTNLTTNTLTVSAGSITTLTADSLTIDSLLTATSGTITTLTTTSLTTDSLDGESGTITNLTTSSLTVSTGLTITGSLIGEKVTTSNIVPNAITTEKLGFNLTTSNIGTSSVGDHTVEFKFSNKD